MNYKEALRMLWNEPKHTKKEIDARDITAFALEKQIAKNTEDKYNCPTCGEIIKFEYQKHCVECGQKFK